MGGPHQSTWAGNLQNKMGRQVVDLDIHRDGNKPWGLRIVGGADVATVMKVEKVLGIDTPAYKAGLKSGDVLVEVQGELITMMTHPQVVNLIRGVRGNTLRLKVERGDHVVPNIQECFPIKTQEDYNEEHSNFHWRFVKQKSPMESKGY